MSENNKKGILEKITSYTSSTKGRILWNFFYGFGASIAILGSLFKLLVLPGANIMLSIGLITESLIFALSAFEAPFKLYKWDKVFPALDQDKNEIGNTIQINGNINTVFTNNANQTQNTTQNTQQNYVH